MNLYKLNEFRRGWIIGDFSPSIIRTKAAEFMIRSYSRGDSEPKHVHNKIDEITAIISGRFRMNDIFVGSGDIVHLAPGDTTDFECIESGTTAVFKTPSIPDDKYIIK